MSEQQNEEGNMMENCIEDTIIEVKRLNYKIGRHYILKDINWAVKKGEHWVIFGLNGSGKTTLLSILAGYQQQTTGALNVFGQKYDSSTILSNRKKIGLVSSSYFDQYYHEESVLEIVLSGTLGTLGLDFDLEDQALKKAKKLLDKVRLKEKTNQIYSTLSKGERENVLIARALIAEPEILILDEPCSGLDVIARNNMLNTVEHLAQEGTTTIIYVTHYIEEILPCFEQCLLLKEGKIYNKGRSIDLLTSKEISEFLQTPVKIQKDEKNTLQITIL